jgi:putative transposase
MPITSCARRTEQSIWAEQAHRGCQRFSANLEALDTVFFKRFYVLFFVHLATRRVVAAACTAEPNSAWVAQQARNLSWKLSDEGINVRVVVHDRDRKFARGFDSVFEADGARVILTPLMAPRANAHAERWARMPGLDADRLPASP